MKELTETERAYLAGFFDGEACINIGTRRPTGCNTICHYLQVAIGQTDESCLLKWQDKLGIGTVHEDRASDRKNVTMRKRAWNWRIYGQQAEDLLRLLLPYLDIKKRQAEIALQFRETKKMGFVGRRGVPEHIMRLRERCKDALHAAKREGTVDNLAELHALNRTLADNQPALPGIEDST